MLGERASPSGLSSHHPRSPTLFPFILLLQSFPRTPVLSLPEFTPHNAKSIQVSPLLVLRMARKNPGGVERRGPEWSTGTSYPDLRPEQAEQSTEAVMGPREGLRTCDLWGTLDSKIAGGDLKALLG